MMDNMEQMVLVVEVVEAAGLAAAHPEVELAVQE
jgi:hypothetical protein